jgi:hypothetical protein
MHEQISQERVEEQRCAADGEEAVDRRVRDCVVCCDLAEQPFRSVGIVD